ncbi:MAG: thioredoxin domain-containing protein [Pseudomonadota bacterium]
MYRNTLLSVSLSALLLSSACAQDSGSAPNREATEEIVRDYLLANPEVIEEALIALQTKRDDEKAAKSREAVAEFSDALMNLASDYSIGPEDAPVTVVEFFDYRCGPCRASMETVNNLPDRYDGKVRVVFKEFPILSPESRKAALAALAAGRQGKYVDMHQALMKSPTDFTDDDLADIAESVGVDVDQWRADLEDETFRDQINATYTLAETIGANATPTFVVEGELFSGLNLPKLDDLINRGIAKAG